MFLAMLAFVPFMSQAQTFDFDMTKKQPVYTDAAGYGYDILGEPKKKSNDPFYFSVKVPDGNYKVKVELGSKKKAGNTTVRAEGRRLMVENVDTKKGQYTSYEFVVNKRNPQINEKERVRIKEREKGYLNWDNKLTLEFNGDAPAVKSIHIERDDSCPTVYLCGNSTVVDQNNEPWASWGQMIPRWFDSGIAISNHAESGLTAGSFLSSKRLEKIMTTESGRLCGLRIWPQRREGKGPGHGSMVPLHPKPEDFHRQRALKGCHNNILHTHATTQVCRRQENNHQHTRRLPRCNEGCG